MDVNAIFRAENPVGTKFLVELEVKEIDGYSNIVSCACGTDLTKEFEKLTGVSVSKVYKKDISVDTTKDMETTLLEMLTKIRELKSQGYNI